MIKQVINSKARLFILAYPKHRAQLFQHQYHFTYQHNYQLSLCAKHTPILIMNQNQLPCLNGHESSIFNLCLQK